MKKWDRQILQMSSGICVAASFLGTALLTACDTAHQAQDAAPKVQDAAPQAHDAVPQAQASTVELKQASGQTLTFTNAGGSDGSFGHGPKAELSFKVSSDKAKVIAEDQKGKDVCYVAFAAPDECRIESPDKKSEFKLRRESDGRYKLKDVGGQEICIIRPEAYGFKIEDSNKQVLYKVHREESKIKLKSGGGSTVLTAKLSVAPIVVACFGLDSLNESEKATLAYTLGFVKDLSQ